MSPLAHVRVLDLTRVLAGPWATQNLGDLGAEIIKVERPGAGDDTRGYGPPFMRDPSGSELDDAVYFFCANRNKKSITLDIASPRGSEIVKRLARESDVLVENFRTGTLARYGLSYADLAPLNPGLIYCSITGFGQDGPDAQRAGYDLLFQGLAGLMSITGERDGRPGGGPQKVGIAVSDILGGMYAALAIVTAIVHRERTGEGQHIDISLLDAMVAFGSGAALTWLNTGTVPKRWGTEHPQIAPYQVFAAADGHMILAVGSDRQFADFCRAAGRPELAADERFRVNAQRVRNRDALLPIVASILARRTRREWREVLDAAGVPCGPINDMREVFEEPQVQHRRMRVDMPHPTAGRAATLANPMRLSASPVSYRTAPPVLGAHTTDILETLLGMPPQEIESLRRAGVV